jgi:hypothetical protein
LRQGPSAREKGKKGGWKGEMEVEEESTKEKKEKTNNMKK